MYFGKRSNFLLVSIFSMMVGSSGALSEDAPPKGFVYVHEIDPTVLVSLRYNSNENFVGRPIDGYKKSVVILTRQAAQALKKAHDEFKKDGYQLVIYDAYRPQQAVDHLMCWSVHGEDQLKKSQYYPRVNKADVFKLGYVAERSGHSRGSTIDLTLIKVGKKLHEVKESQRTLLDGYTITFLDDGTVDMGSSFDLFDVASHFKNDVITDNYKTLRRYLREIMEKHGFKGCGNEWWHFTLRNEPFPSGPNKHYFNFLVE
jgi:D-alanyl-D-alanine dipeptidase